MGAGVGCARGAARAAARCLLARFDLGAFSLTPRRGLGPAWPEGLAGSLAHDDALAAAALCRTSCWRSVGIDVEPALPLPEEVLDIVVLPAERRHAPDLVAARLLFCVKEAVYKATHPLDGVFLEPHDVEVDLPAGLARTSTGRTLRISVERSTHLFALAAISPG